jgi:CRISPR-associated exonuclease Cas4
MAQRANAVYEEGELLPISALQHLVFCERQCALIHVEGIWQDNALTASGNAAHERVDGAPGETRRDVRIARGLALRSLRLGLTGRADVVEFHRFDTGVPVEGLSGKWVPFPVEYKRGRPKTHRADEVQLCAQALCLEEMLGTEVRDGALFYGQPRRRTMVLFDAELRELVERAAARLHELVAGGRTPRAVYEKKCDACSLYEICRPRSATRSASSYVSRSLEEAADEELPAT